MQKNLRHETNQTIPRNAVVAAGAMLLAAGLVAGAASSALAADPVTIRFAITEPSKNPEAKMQQLFAPFAAAHPNIKVVFEPEYASDITKFTTQMVAGTAPDLVEGYNELPVLGIQRGFYLDLSPYIQRDNQGALLKDFVPATVAQYSAGGHVYGFPQLSAVGAMYYNRDMFANAGLGAPNPDWNWSEFAAIAAKLTQKDGSGKTTQFGYELYPNWLWAFGWFESAGADFSDAHKLSLDSDSARAAAQYLQDLKKAGTLDWNWGTFPGQKAAMTNSGSWEFNYWVDQKLPLGITSVPTGAAGKVTLTNTNMVGITRDTKHPEEAWQVLNWFYSKPVQQQYLELFAQQPARLSLGLEWVGTLKQYLTAHNAPAVPGIETFVTDSGFAHPQPFFADPNVVGKYVQPALDAILKDGKPVGSTLTSAASAGTAFLNSATK